MDSPDWSGLSDDELLERRISRLGLKLDGTTLKPLIQQLYDELSQKGLVFCPPCHIGDEWFVPVVSRRFHSVLSDTRPVTAAGTQNHSRSRRRNAGNGS